MHAYSTAPSPISFQVVYIAFHVISYSSNPSKALKDARGSEQAANRMSDAAGGMEPAKICNLLFWVQEDTLAFLL